jgi:hypothetical protein
MHPAVPATEMYVCTRATVRQNLSPFVDQEDFRVMSGKPPPRSRNPHWVPSRAMIGCNNCEAPQIEGKPLKNYACLAGLAGESDCFIETPAPIPQES